MARARASSTPANPNVAPGRTLGASYAAGDGYIDPPRNVLAYTAALFTAGVEVRERTAMTGLVTDGGRVTGVQTTAGDIATDRVVITGGPQLRAIGELARRADPVGRRPAPGRRHRAAPRRRAGAAADGLRPRGRHLLAAVRGRRDVGHEQPGRAAGRRARVRLGLLREGPRAGRRAGARRSAGSACVGPGPRPSTTPRTTCRSSARCSSATGRPRRWSRSPARRSPRPAATG